MTVRSKSYSFLYLRLYDSRTKIIICAGDADDVVCLQNVLYLASYVKNNSKKKIILMIDSTVFDIGVRRHGTVTSCIACQVVLYVTVCTENN